MKEGLNVMKVVRAKRTRRCNECGNAIEPGEWHLKYNSNSYYSKNVCWYCLDRLLQEIREKNYVKI